ncbi:anthranilate synthase component I family protein [Microbacterium sp. NPDC057407]|uniref:anthranilate synthase component I family protein n=1 Tax=Microbacterium sp. NPDC057407 TaxID=3346120 RepID=UPI003672290F
MTDPSHAVELGEWIEPEAVFMGLFADDDRAFWLDAGPAATTGWSWVGSGTPGDVEAVMGVVCAADTGDEWRAGPFRGGWVGWQGYDDAAARAGAPARREAEVPGALWLRVTSFLAFDHDARRAWAVGPEVEARRLADAVRDAAGAVAPPSSPATVVARPRHAPDRYADLIERCRERIRAGDAYQLCLTTRFEVTGRVAPVETFRRLRELTAAHHGGLIAAPGASLASASPEQFLEVRDGIVRTRPIKGTRPRGAGPVADAAVAAELQASEKERAENVMIVDLMRNDLSRVCEPGSVGVDALLEVETYPAVHQLVSTVSGSLEPGTTVGALLAAAFPAGSMTGAPKLSAMTILEELEAAPRGVFAGCFGWVGVDGALDLAMVIRSIVVHPGGAYVGAGGGITWRSDAAAEVAEVAVKARGPLAALGAALPPGW